MITEEHIQNALTYIDYSVFKGTFSFGLRDKNIREKEIPVVSNMYLLCKNSIHVDWESEEDYSGTTRDR